MNSRSNLSVIIVLILSSCLEKKQIYEFNPNNIPAPTYDHYSFNKLIVSKYEKDKELTRLIKTVDNLELLNKEYCQLLKKKYSSCKLNNRIYYSAVDEIPMCEIDKNFLFYDTQIEAHLTSHHHKELPPLQILINNYFLSQEIFLDKKTNLNFVLLVDSKLHAKLIPIKIVDISNIKIIAKNQVIDAVPNYLNLTLKVNGNLILNDSSPKDLSPLQKHRDEGINPLLKNYVKKSFTFDYESLFLNPYRDQCTISTNQTNAAKVRIQQQLSNDHKYDEPRIPVFDEVKESPEEHLKLKDELLVATQNIHALQLKELELQDIHNELSRKIKNDYTGCRRHQKIEELSISLKGQYENLYLGYFGDKKFPYGSSRNSSTLHFDFGGVKFPIDFAKTNIFKHQFKINPNNVYISSIDKLSIEKKYFDFENYDEPCDPFKAGKRAPRLQKFFNFFRNDTCYERYEPYAFQITGIVVSINGDIAFSENFASSQKVYTDNKYLEFDLKNNPSWSEFISSKNCNQIN